jgi:hypothetical protein
LTQDFIDFTGMHVPCLVIREDYDTYILLAFGSLAIAYFRLSRMMARAGLREDEARLREITVT